MRGSSILNSTTLAFEIKSVYHFQSCIFRYFTFFSSLFYVILKRRREAKNDLQRHTIRDITVEELCSDRHVNQYFSRFFLWTLPLLDLVAEWAVRRSRAGQLTHSVHTFWWTFHQLHISSSGTIACKVTCLEWIVCLATLSGDILTSWSSVPYHEINTMIMFTAMKSCLAAARNETSEWPLAKPLLLSDSKSP